MGKIISNVFAYINGFIIMTKSIMFNNDFHVGSGMRAFCGSCVRLYSKCRGRIGNNFRIDDGSVVSVLNNACMNIGDGVALGRNNMVVCHGNIIIGENTITGPNVLIYDHDHVFNKENGVNKHKYNVGEIKIGKNCWIGANVVVLRNTTIGDNCVIGAGCVVKGEIPSNTVLVQKRENLYKYL